MRKPWSFVLAVGVTLAGCTKKAEPLQPPAPQSSASVGSIIGSPPDSAPPPPPNSGTTQPTPTTTPVAIVDQSSSGAALSPADAEKKFKQAQKDEAAYEQRLRKHVKWLQAMQNGTEQDRQRILAEIRSSNLSPAELAELEGIKGQFGIAVSFR